MSPKAATDDTQTPTGADAPPTGDDTPSDDTTPVTEAQAKDADPKAFVFIRHSNDADDVEPGRVTVSAFEKKWKAKGFSIVDPTKTGTEASSSE